jgi:hypothetical protein
VSLKETVCEGVPWINFDQDGLQWRGVNNNEPSDPRQNRRLIDQLRNSQIRK